jgi:hypothetical protein
LVAYDPTGSSDLIGIVGAIIGGVRNAWVLLVEIQR